MDTHITTAPDLGFAGTPLRPPVGLPGEVGRILHGIGPAQEDAPASATGSDQASPSHRPCRRRGLLATAAVGSLVLASAGGTGWWFRHDLPALDLHRLEVPSFLRPGSRLAAQPPAEVGMRPGAAPAVQARRPETVPASPSAGRQASEFAALQSFSGSPVAEIGVDAPAPAAPSPDAAPRQPARAGTVPSTATQTASSVPVTGPTPAADTAPISATAAERSPAAPPVTSATAPAEPAAAAQRPAAPANLPAPTAPSAQERAVEGTPAAPAPREPVAIAAELRPAPLTPAEQVRVVDLVKELGAQLRDTRTEVAQLRATVGQLVEAADAKLLQFESRLSLAEAGTVLAQSARAGHPEPPAPLPTPGAAPVPRVAASGRAALPAPATHPAAVPAAVPAAPAPRTPKDYRVQGASPGLALLSVLSPPPGGPGVIEVAPGSEVPGLGRVKGISQRGTTWIVQTEAGPIQ